MNDSTGRKLLDWRKERGLSQRAAASLAGLPQPTWTKLEGSAAFRVSVDVASRIEKVTDGAVTVADYVLEVERVRRRRSRLRT